MFYRCLKWIIMHIRRWWKGFRKKW